MDTTLDHTKANARLSRGYWTLAALFAAFFSLSSLYISAHRQLWFDEILTALVCRLPSLRVMWTALSEIEEQTPPIYFVIERLFDQIFRHSDLGLRVPSALALGAGLLVTYDAARRLTNGFYGLIAVSLVATPFVAYYGYEARSYAIYFLLASTAFWLWIGTNAENWPSAVAFGAVFLVGVAIHYYFVLCILPFAVAALLEGRIFRPKLVAAATGIVVSLAALYPQIAKSKKFASSVSAVWAPSAGRLLGAYREFAPDIVLIVAVIAVCIVVFARRRTISTIEPMKPGERIGWLFFGVPLFAYGLGHFLTHLFHDRYVIGAAPGIAIAATCALWRYFRESKFVSVALLLVLSAHSIGRQLLTLRRVDHIQSDSGDYQERTRQLLGIEDSLQTEGKQHVVVPWDVEYLETWYYSKNRNLYECLTTENRWTIKKYVPLQFVSMDEIAANAPQSAIVTPSPDIARSLARKGIHLKVRSSQSQYVLFYFK